MEAFSVLPDFGAGVIILGRAVINTAVGEGNIEGIPESETRGAYGGENDADDSGVLRYVSIRHGGTDIGEGNEINGLTLGAVGNSTTIDHIEIINNNDDGVEFFGGTVNCKYMIVAFCKDDSFDIDEGYRGYGQYWFTIQADDWGDKLGEHDGGTEPEDGLPFAHPIIYNATYIGKGMNSLVEKNAFHIRDNWGGEYHNSIFGDVSEKAIEIEDLDSGEDSRARLEAGDIIFANNIFFDFAAGNTFTDLVTDDWIAPYIENTNLIGSPDIASISRIADGNLDPRPANSGLAFTSDMSAIPEDLFFDNVNFKGAFGAYNWAYGWTALHNYGILVDDQGAAGVNDITVTDADVTGADVYWTRDTVYHLDGFIFVEEGTTLHIEAGTVIKGLPGQGADASALIIARGGMIMAEGTAEDPIIFTAESDPLDGSLFGTSGLWGGVIILGNAVINTAVGEGNIEGIPESEPRGAYGGDNDTESSGVFRYISIRHGGTDIGEGNEINGLTLGAVGNGTTIDHIEIINNNDDGVEFFGGTVNCKYMIVAFCKDDSFDIDEGYRGYGQFWFTIQGEDWGDKLGEHDGGTEPEDGLPYAHPVIYNATYLGKGMNALVEKNAFHIRDNWGGEYHNSIFGDDSEKALEIEDLDSGEDSRARLEAGDIVFANDLFFDFAAGSTLADLVTDDWILPYIENDNSVADPQLGGISRTTDGNLDPRPAEDGPAYTGDMSPILETTFFESVDYKGAFGKANWAYGWTALYDYGILIDDEGIITSVDSDQLPTAVQLGENYPNPFNPTTTISFTIPETGLVSLTIFNALGQKVDTLINDAVMLPGYHALTWNAANQSTGVYFYRLESGSTTITRRMLLVK